MIIGDLVNILTTEHDSPEYGLIVKYHTASELHEDMHRDIFEVLVADDKCLVFAFFKNDLKVIK